MIFLPVVETAFGVIPDTPLNLLRKTDELHHIPIMYGYMADDGAFMVSDPDNDGVTLEEFKMATRYVITMQYPPNEQDAVYNKALSKYLPKDPSKLSKLELREILVQAATGEFCLGRMIREARYFSKATRGDQSDIYVFDFNHRPSYSRYPAWTGVNHADEKGFVLGLPVGPDPFMYPNYTRDDEIVADFVMTTWTNFAKYGNPTPSPVHSVKWPQFKPGSDEKVMVIQTSPEVKDFDREVDVEVWASEDSKNNGGNGGYCCQAQMSIWVMCLLVVMLLWKQ